jgi:hypothetical protein
MLPIVITAKRHLVAATMAVSIAALPAAPALAWGDREQGFVAGVATAVIVDRILRQQPLIPRARPAQPTYFVDPTPSRPAIVNPAPMASSSIYRTPAARAFQSYSPAERKAIQRNLRAWGYYRGGIDGAFGPGTYSAVADYARDEGLSSNLATSTGAYAVYDGLLF